MNKQNERAQKVAASIMDPVNQILDMIRLDTARKKEMLCGCGMEMEKYLASMGGLELPSCILPGYGRFLSLLPWETGAGETYELFLNKNQRSEPCFMLLTLPGEDKPEEGAQVHLLRRRKDRWQTYDGESSWRWIDYEAHFEFEGELLDEFLEKNGAPFTQIYGDMETSLELAAVTTYLVGSAVEEAVPRLLSELEGGMVKDSFFLDKELFLARVLNYSIFETNDFPIGKLKGAKGETLELGILSTVKGETLEEEVTPYIQFRDEKGELKRKELETFVAKVSTGSQEG